MKKFQFNIIVLFSLIPGIAGPLRADDLPTLFPVLQNGKYGYINTAGEIVITPRFQRDGSVNGSFSEGLQAAWVGDKAGYIDTTGKMVIEPQFSLAGAFSQGFAAVRVTVKPWKYGYIDKTGRLVIPPQFDSAEGFSDGRAAVVVDGKLGYIDKSGGFIVPPQYLSYSPQHSTFAEGLACVMIADLWGFIDKQGKVVIQPQFGGPSSFHNGLAVAHIRSGVGSSNEWGYIDKTGVYAFKPRFSLAWAFSEGLARVRDGGMAFIDKSGNVVFTVADGKWAGEFSEGLVNVEMRRRSSGKSWGYLDSSGKWAIEPRFQKAEPFHNGLARVIVDNKFAYITKMGHYVWGPDSGNEALAANLRSQASPEQWRKNQQELLRLAKLIDPTNPPLTEQSIQSGDFPVEALQKLAANDSEHARSMLEHLLTYPANPELVEMSPDLAEMNQDEIQTQVAGALIAIGDPFVLPTLRRWLRDAVKVEGEFNLHSMKTVGCAVEGVKQFRDGESHELLELLLKSTYLDRWKREAVVSAIAELGLARAKPILLESLNDEQLGEGTRCEVAAALVRMDESKGRAFLLEKYNLYLDRIRKQTSSFGESRRELELLGDARLIAALEAKADAEPPGVPKNNINTLLDVMRVSAMPADQLKAVATNGTYANVNVRLHAIRFMSHQGGIDLLPFLESLRISTEDYDRADWNKLRIFAIENAILRIRMRERK